MAIAQFKIDVFEQLRGHELCLINTVEDELHKLSKGNSKDANAALLALHIIATKDLKMLKTNEKNADKSLIKYSIEGYIIATQDIRLRERIKKAGGKAIYIRQKKYVII